MKYKPLFFSLLLGSLLACSMHFRLHATHLRAGQITVSRIDPNALTYRITLIVFRDVQGVPADPTATITILPNNISITQPLFDEVPVAPQVTRVRYFFTFTFPGPGTYKLGYREQFRNGCIVNMNNPLETDLFVETEVVIQPFLGFNNSPVLLAAPVDEAALGRRFLHNPAAYDPDGDSLAFSLVTPRRNFDVDVANYRPLNNFLSTIAEDGGTPFFGIDPVTGTVTWDAPAGLPNGSCVNIAIKVEEWRKVVNSQGQVSYFYLGYVVRDMQIIVRQTENRRPILQAPSELCVAATQESINETITATDPDNHSVRITATGQPFDDGFPLPRATFTSNTGNPAVGTLQWSPSCEHIRAQPYQIVFKAEDIPPAPLPSLVDIHVLTIRVVGPKPQNLQATTNSSNRSITLSWDPYNCASRVQRLIVWRRDGCDSSDPQLCDTGAPEGQGYVAIAQLPATATTYTDNDVRIGRRYSYRISAVFLPPAGGESYASDAVCVALPINVPLFTKVDVLNTDATNGSIEVNFIQPFQFPSGAPPAPYGYIVYRGEGLVGPTPERVFSIFNVDPTDRNIISFTDNGINTLDKAYHYRIDFFSNATDESSAILVDSSDQASSVRLSLNPQSNCIDLRWDYNTPWSNSRQPHDILRSIDAPDSFTLIGQQTPLSPGFATFTDTDAGQNNLTYYYYTLTRGSYYNDDINNEYPSLQEPLLNNSQINSAQPNDQIPPCPPTLEADLPDCTTFDFEAGPPYSNQLRWRLDDPGNGQGPPACGEIFDGCEFEPNNIERFRIYYKPTTLDPSYTLLAELSASEFAFQHTGLISLAGCYVVTAVDQAGNESDYSNEVCIDNCILFVLPNVFTPNNDGFNDRFTPKEPLRFVEKIEFEVFNRWGRRVFFSPEDPMINWDGTANVEGSSEGGKPLPAGVYYYHARVHFTRVDPREKVKNFRGWIHLIR